MHKNKITVVGSYNTGLFMSVPRIPVVGETVMGSNFHSGPGGKGSNQAIGARRLGAEVSFVSVLGQDAWAENAIKMYKQEGINTDCIRQTQDLPTGCGFILIGPDGENLIAVDSGANNLVGEHDIDAAAGHIAQSRLLLAQMEIPLKAVIYALQAARKAGILTILNPAPAAKLPEKIFPLIDILTPNETELKILSGLAPDTPVDTTKLARNLFDKGLKTIVVTLGEKGALIVEKNRTELIPSFPVKAVDTTGAGDAFSAALAVGLAEEKNLPEAVRMACAVGALTVTKLGVVPALPCRKDVDRFISGAAAKLRAAGRSASGGICARPV